MEIADEGGKQADELLTGNWRLSALQRRVLPHCSFSRNLKGMEVYFAPDLQARIDQLVIEAGYAADKLLADAMAETLSSLRKRARFSTTITTI